MMETVGILLIIVALLVGLVSTGAIIYVLIGLGEWFRALARLNHAKAAKEEQMEHFNSWE